MLRNLKLFLIAILVIVIVFHWNDGFSKMKQSGANVTFWQYAKDDTLFRLKESQKFLSELPSTFSDAVQSDDKVKRGAINKLADAIEIYRAENDRYPETAQKMIGYVIGSQTKILEEKGFSYTPTDDGQHFKMSIPLKNGELYTVER